MHRFLFPTLLALCLFLSTNVLAQPGKGYQTNYRSMRSGNWIVDKNFYLLTVIDKTPAVSQLIRQDTALARIGRERSALIRAHASDTCQSPGSLITGFRWSTADSAQLLMAVQKLYKQHPKPIDQLIDTQLRPSGYYQRFVGLSNADLWARAWAQYVVGTNYILDQYGLGRKMRYPRIDSANYLVNGRYYRTVLKDLFAALSEGTDTLQRADAPSLAVGLQLMLANDRDEPARHEPLERRDNKLSAEQTKQIPWAKYKYAAIVVPGNGPELTTTPLSPLNKMRLELVAHRYRQGWAPLIAVSGGYCYPFRGPYAEAVEMKRYLMTQYGIPESAIIIDPQARHTTTNFRNINRLLIQYGAPVDKPYVMTTTQSQASYISQPAFDARNQRELGYLPYRDKQRISPHDITYYPTLESLHLDPYDPLDP